MHVYGHVSRWGPFSKFRIYIYIYIYAYNILVRARTGRSANYSSITKSLPNDQLTGSWHSLPQYMNTAIERTMATFAYTKDAWDEKHAIANLKQKKKQLAPKARTQYDKWCKSMKVGVNLVFNKDLQKHIRRPEVSSIKFRTERCFGDIEECPYSGYCKNILGQHAHR